MMRRDPLKPHPSGETPVSTSESGYSVPAPPAVRRDEDVGLIENFAAPAAVPVVPEFDQRPDGLDDKELDPGIPERTTTSFRIDGGTVTTFPPKEPPGDGVAGGPEVLPWEPTYESFNTITPDLLDGAPGLLDRSSDPDPGPRSAIGSTAKVLGDDYRDHSDSDGEAPDPPEAPSIFASGLGSDQDLDSNPEPTDAPFWAVTTDLPATHAESSQLQFAPMDPPEQPEPEQAMPAAPDGPITVDQALYGMDEPESAGEAGGERFNSDERYDSGERFDSGDSDERYDSDIELDALLADLSAVAGKEPSDYDAVSENDLGPFGDDGRLAAGSVDNRPPSRPEPRPGDEPAPGTALPQPQPRPERRPQILADPTPADRPGSGTRSDVANRGVVSPHLVNRPIIQAEDMGRAERFDGRFWSTVLKGLLMVMVLAIVVLVALSVS